MKHKHNLGWLDRVVRCVFGLVLIGIAYFSEGSLGWMITLPFLAMIPLMTAFMGYCPFKAAVEKVVVLALRAFAKTQTSQVCYGY